MIIIVKVKENLTGKKFGRLIVLCQTDDYINSKGEHFARWLCECSCEDHNIIAVRGDSLKSGNTQSCGCIHREGLIQTGKNNKKENKYDLSGQYGIGWTSNTNQEFYFDLDDYDKIKDYCWNEHILTHGYHALEAKDYDSKKIIRMQWLIKGKYYDHINRNPLDNRKDNLRQASKNENNQNHKRFINNTSGFSGVNWHKKQNKWHARITVNNKRIHLGYFNTKYEAIIARLQAELKYYGKEFAPQRHLFEEYGVLDSKEGDPRE